VLFNNIEMAFIIVHSRRHWSIDNAVREIGCANAQRLKELGVVGICHGIGKGGFFEKGREALTVASSSI
jgi:hypothetical protein